MCRSLFPASIYVCLSCFTVYIDADASNGEENLSLFAMVGTTTTNPGTNVVTPATNYTWNVRVEQIDCTRDYQLQGHLLFIPIELY